MSDSGTAVTPNLIEGDFGVLSMAWRGKYKRADTLK